MVVERRKACGFCQSFVRRTGWPCLPLSIRRATPPPHVIHLKNAADAIFAACTVLDFAIYGSKAPNLKSPAIARCMTCGGG
jgi:hypothetical protein